MGDQKTEQNDQANRQAERKNVRVQLDFDPDSYEEVVDLKFALRLKTKADVIRYALRVLRWTVEQNSEGHKILVDVNGNLQQVIFPFLPPRNSAKESGESAETQALRERIADLVEKSGRRVRTEGREEVVIGKTYLGKVVLLTDFGAFVEILPGTEGLLHISEIAEQRIRDIRDELKLGDQVLVKVLAIEGNRIRLSHKAILREQREKQQRDQEEAIRAASELGRETYQRDEEQQR